MYLEAALAILPAITAVTSILSVQAELFLAIYVLSHPGTDMSLWKLGGAAFRSLQEIGLHRRLVRGRGYGGYEEEQRRRTFWSAYVLDR